jgi:hypothetical protein
MKLQPRVPHTIRVPLGVRARYERHALRCPNVRAMFAGFGPLCFTKSYTVRTSTSPGTSRA